MRYIFNSDELMILEEKTETQINLFIQFFIHPNPERYNEIKTCLKMNVLNPFISYIYLLNEQTVDENYRLFTEEELGIYSEKIIQIPLGHRLMYNDVFEFAQGANCGGYNIIANADIFFDDSLENLLRSNMNTKPIMMCQLRYEYDGTPRGIKIFGPRGDSQDAWIYHSSYNKLLVNNKAFRFQLGQAGCDNHITYLFKHSGFELINDPQNVHCMHYHQTQIREYKGSDTIKPPYILINPHVVAAHKVDVAYDDNDYLYDFIICQFENNEPFIIPRVAGIENITAYDALTNKDPRCYVMKNNAGVMLSNMKSVKKYSKAYFKAFENSKVYCGWDANRGDNVYNGIADSHKHIDEVICPGSKKIWAETNLEIYNFIKRERVWTEALKGKRILVISSFIESISEKIPVLDKIYGRDLFPDCKFVFVKPPMLNCDSISQEWDIELNNFCLELDKLRDDYDIALVSCGGLGNLVCNYIYEEHKKSSIYVGGVLSVWFGVYNRRLIEEKSTILRMYLNEHWSRPKVSERPVGWEKTERGCYW
jgi:hypothetical protein